MFVGFLRSSSLKEFNNGCPFRYFIEYCLGYRSVPGKAAIIGTAIHKMMELLARAKQKLDDHSVFYDEEFDKTYDVEHLLNVDNDLELADEVWGFYTKENSDVEWVRADYTKYKRIIRKGLQFFDPRLEEDIITVEEHFQIPFDDTQLYGTMDLVVNQDGLYNIVDYKSGSHNNYTLEDFENDVQVKTYTYVVSQLYGTTNIAFSLIYMDHFKRFDVIYDEEYINGLGDQLLGIYDNIKNCTSPPRDISWKCSKWCQWGKTYAENGKTVCNFLYDNLIFNGMDRTIKDYGSKNGPKYNRG